MPPVSPIASTTQHHLGIEDICQDLIILNDGSAALILQVGAVNFDLLSEKEQEAIIYSYAGLLNSLTFPIQILVRSQKKDVSNYLRLLENQQAKAKIPKRKQQIQEYRQFINQVVKEGNVLDKKFYLIVPFSRTELGLKASNPLSLKKPTGLPYKKDYIIQKALTSLYPKKEHLVRQFARLGLGVKQLTTQELIRLLYGVYNHSTLKSTSLSVPKLTNLSTPKKSKDEPPTSSPAAVIQSIQQSVSPSSSPKS